MKEQIDEVVSQDIQVMEMIIQRKGNRWQCPVLTCLRLNALQKKGKVLEILDIGVIEDIRKIIKDKRIV